MLLLSVYSIHVYFRIRATISAGSCGAAAPAVPGIMCSIVWDSGFTPHRSSSEDGTLRKSPHLWREWSSRLSLELHAEQLAVALRSVRLLRGGGRMVYSIWTEGSDQFLDFFNERWREPKLGEIS